MKLEEALPKLTDLVQKQIREVHPEYITDMTTNKGALGQLLERTIGLSQGSSLLDFEDGELKTNKSKQDGSPKETMFITQISRSSDTLLSQPPVSFEESNLYNKIRRLIYLPICKDSQDPGDWFFTGCYYIDLDQDVALRNQLEADYYDICSGLRRSIEESPDGFIHTTNGELIQIRSKDSKPYHPIYSDIYGREVSNKNHAFYFKKDFMNQIRLRG